ncbi:histidine kinase [Mucilaginibacter sp. SMC90]|uniref:sensor histidine kinase n=1 Tax=Mucilaginibacter sp. SMC90 TaxID=2929803 RepID=UPI001FB26A08|nr:histidine kinase [Mucilaginibacter sp. SMC90]UOE52540.1 histidine kinase [Mucilaginibacter sp. SMC90]
MQRSRLEIEQLKQVNLRAQVIGLQQQLSPHFLFNSLSTLKGLTPDETSKEFIMHLSTIYRYLLVSGERQIVTLSEELEFVKAYVFIQQKRFGKALEIQMEIPERYSCVKIPPLSVQLLIENAIKHNAFSHESPLQIVLHIDTNNYLAVINDRREKITPPEGLGLGLQNIRERYKLLLNAEIIVKAQPDRFTVFLPLTFHENNNN